MKRLISLAILLTLWASVAFGADYFEVKAQADKNNIQISFHVPKDHYLYADTVKVKLLQPDNAKLIVQNITEPEIKDDPFSGQKVKAYKHDFTQIYTLTPATDIEKAQLKVSFQGCSSTTCFLPETKTLSISKTKLAATAPKQTTSPNSGWKTQLNQFRQTGSIVGYVAPKAFIKKLDEITSGKSTPDNDENLFAGKSLFMSILLVILGGLALNLTPCVLPMIPINIAVIGAGAQAGTKSRGFLLGSIYGAGIAFAYGILGVFVVLTGSTFGALNSSPVFNAAIAIIFAILALGMFGVFELDFTRFRPQTTPGQKKKGGLILPFFMGSVAALLAGACVAPVVISVLLFSSKYYASGNVIGLFLPFILGLGMALPWPFAGAGLSFLPKPGAWMDYVKKGFGIFIILFALYYAHLAYSLWQPVQQNHTSAVHSGDWLHSLEEGLTVAAANNKPVFIDFWASWCKNCSALDNVTFKNEAVIKKLESFVKIKVQAEKPQEKSTKELLDSFSVAGLPTMVVLEKK